MTLIGVIADDLTGAMDTGAQFRRAGVSTVVYLGPGALGETGVVAGASECGPHVLVVNTATRNRPPEEARRIVEAVCAWLRDAGAAWVYKKIDSTLRGNIGIELDAVMDCMELPFACVAPAFPALGRTTVDGHMLLNGQPVKHTEMSADALSPVRDSFVPAVVRRQSRRLIRHMPLSLVRQGARTMAHSLREAFLSGIEVIVIDSETQHDLDQTAAAVMSLYLPVIMCGSAGLALGLVNSLGLAGMCGAFQTPGTPGMSPSVERRAHTAPAIIVVGSRSRVAAGQLEYLRAHASAAHFDLGIHELKAGGGLQLGPIIEALEAGCDVALSATCVSIPAGETSDTIVAGLGGVVRTLLERLGTRSLVLTGGDTAVGVCAQLEALRIVLAGEILPGMPVGTLAGGPFDGLTVVTKAGAFGDEDALLQALRYVRDSAKGDAT